MLLCQIDELAHAIHEIDGGPGIVNYTITKLLHYLYTFQQDISYAKCNEIIGILECVKQEFYRRQAAPYEDIKKEENGDVF